jgi:hypothetical protein
MRLQFSRNLRRSSGSPDSCAAEILLDDRMHASLRSYYTYVDRLILEIPRIRKIQMNFHIARESKTLVTSRCLNFWLRIHSSLDIEHLEYLLHSSGLLSLAGSWKILKDWVRISLSCLLCSQDYWSRLDYHIKYRENYMWTHKPSSWFIFTVG